MPALWLVPRALHGKPKEVEMPEHSPQAHFSSTGSMLSNIPPSSNSSASRHRTTQNNVVCKLPCKYQ